MGWDRKHDRSRVGMKASRNFLRHPPHDSQSVALDVNILGGYPGSEQAVSSVAPAYPSSLFIGNTHASRQLHTNRERGRPGTVELILLHDYQHITALHHLPSSTRNKTV